jgi:PTS system N-acetylgalactosamine-specific IIB component
VIALVRVDNRLVHGQVLVTWVPHLQARRLVVADDDAARSPLARAAMALAIPPGLEATVLPIAEVPWRGLASSPDPVMVVLRDVADLVRARLAGLEPRIAPRLNLGNVHFAPGRRQITPSVFLTGEEVDTLRGLRAHGFDVEARAVPAEAPVGLDEIERRWNAGR